jgi:hypothetical protein
MGWMQVRLRVALVRQVSLGAAAGAWAAFLAEGALILSDWTGLDWLRTYFPVLVLGATFGALFAPVDELSQGLRQRALRAALLGAALGAVAVTLTYAACVAFTPGPSGKVVSEGWSLPVARWLGFALGLATAAASASLASGWAIGNARLGLRRAGRGLAAGAVLGLILAVAGNVSGGNAWVLLAGLTVWAALLALAVFWLERRRAKHWLRILAGTSEDAFFPLQRSRITLGKSETNDVPLPGGQEVYPRHCEIRWSNDHYEIVDDEQGGVVLVNFRQIQEHVLKPGDLVKLGSVLLQYGEAQRR